MQYLDKRLSPASLVSSALLNLFLLLFLTYGAALFGLRPPQPPQTAEVELVTEPPKPSPAAPPAEKREAPKPEPKPQPRAEETPPPPPPPPPPPAKPRAPQLAPAPLARQATAPHRRAPGAAEKVEAVPGPSALGFGKGPLARDGAEDEGPELTQTEQDFILAQIMKYWNVDTHVPEARGLVLSAKIVIRADGTLASPLSKNDPWNPSAVIHDYAAMARGGFTYQRQAIEAFLLALRVAQPLRLPPGGTWPRHMTLRFSFDDM